MSLCSRAGRFLLAHHSSLLPPATYNATPRGLALIPRTSNSPHMLSLLFCKTLFSSSSTSRVSSSPSDEKFVDVTAELTRSLEHLVSSESGTFSCGGSIPVVVDAKCGSSSSLKEQPTQQRAKASKDDNKITTSHPVAIRWDPPSAQPNESRNACFPISADSTGNGMAGLEMLLRDCQPATFGRGSKDVLDETYRKATKLDATEFSTNFCPYALGLVDTAAELLMPSSSFAGGSRGVKAELYKLNVYAGPSGRFKPHVDTPRSDEQFGSLVVCLPCAHTGGGLVVRHEGQSVTYDWSTADNDPPATHWAAFYSDCEHEVLEVTEGNRITLTFNLYAVPHRIQIEGKTESLDVTGLPLYRAVKEVLGNPAFLPNGGTLGCFCSHAYPHTATSPADAPLFPSILKGSDLYLYSVFSALGLNVDIRPILEEASDSYEWEDKLQNEEDYIIGEGYDNDEGDDVVDDDDVEDADDVKHKADEVSEEGDNAADDAVFVVDKDAGNIRPLYVGKKSCNSGAVESKSFARETHRENCEQFGPRMMVYWLNEPVAGAKDAGYYYPTYGNGPTMSSKYTHAALMVTIEAPARRRCIHWSR